MPEFEFSEATVNIFEVKKLSDMQTKKIHHNDEFDYRMKPLKYVHTWI